VHVGLRSFFFESVGVCVCAFACMSRAVIGRMYGYVYLQMYVLVCAYRYVCKCVYLHVFFVSKSIYGMYAHIHVLMDGLINV